MATKHVQVILNEKQLFFVQKKKSQATDINYLPHSLVFVFISVESTTKKVLTNFVVLYMAHSNIKHLPGVNNWYT